MKSVLIFCLLLILLTLMLVPPALSVGKAESYYNKKFCDKYIGKTETSYRYEHGIVFVDCETETHVWEGGLDKRSSLDSLQQALFFSELTGKLPAVVIYDSDGKEGLYEYRIRKVCERLGILYINWKVNNG